jgi:transposase-like protein
MAPRKLSDADKQAVIEAYRQSGDTAATLASRYGVSNSTISRILKQSLPEDEYEVLVQQRRSGARGEDLAETEDLQADLPKADLPKAVPLKPVAPPKPVAPVGSTAVLPAVSQPELLESMPSLRRQRQRSTVQSTKSSAANDLPLPEPQMAQLELKAALTQPVDDPAKKIEGISPPNPVVKGIAASIKLRNANSEGLSKSETLGSETLGSETLGSETLGSETLGSETLSSSYAGLIDEDLEEALEDEDDLEDDLDGDLDEDDLEDDLDDEAEGGAIAGFGGVQIARGKSLQILPLSEATIPRTCYVVVDRASELITRPLKDFAELGQIPEAENQQKTLPIFDNHRIAKRFLRRMQRVVKVPDGRVLQKVRPYLQAKGITRLLIDGQIYSV